MGNSAGFFDLEVVLRKAGGKECAFRKDEVVFTQGDPADAVFYIRKGTVKVKINSGQGKEAVVGVRSARGRSSAKAASPLNMSGWPRLSPWTTASS